MNRSVVMKQGFVRLMCGESPVSDTVPCTLTWRLEGRKINVTLGHAPLYARKTTTATGMYWREVRDAEGRLLLSDPVYESVPLGWSVQSTDPEPEPPSEELF